MSVKDSIEQCRRDIEKLRDTIAVLRTGNSSLRDEAERQRVLPSKLNLHTRRVLKGHFGKIYAMQWADDSRHLVSASQDGKLIIWNAFTSNKVHAIPLRSSWVMTCAYSPTGSYVACGGLDNTCSVFKLPVSSAFVPNQQPHAELAQHEGYLSCCRFISDSEIVSSSGDGSCILWDIATKQLKMQFTDHVGDVMSVSIYHPNGQFISGSCDATAKLWDPRVNRQNCVKTFNGHDSDINSVQFMSDGQSFVSGSDDSSVRLFDIRAYREIGKYTSDKILCGITSVGPSVSGKFIFAGYDDYSVYVWDTLLGQCVTNLAGHENRVSSIGVTKDGRALCTASWDTTLRIWA